MARMVGLSRARFYQLQKEGYFPQPERDTEASKPYYSEELQHICLEVRRRNFGVNGKKILFYAARRQTVAPRTIKTKAPKANQHRGLVEGLQALGLTTTTNTQVGAALKEKFPKGTEAITEAEVIKVLFLHLKRQN